MLRCTASVRLVVLALGNGLYLRNGTVRERMCLCMYATDPPKPRLERDIRSAAFSLPENGLYLTNRLSATETTLQMQRLRKYICAYVYKCFCMMLQPMSKTRFKRDDPGLRSTVENRAFNGRDHYSCRQRDGTVGRYCEGAGVTANTMMC